jgi:hypothetical protein
MPVERQAGILAGQDGLLAAGDNPGPCTEGCCSPEDLVVAQQLYSECSDAHLSPGCLDRSCIEAGEEETYLAITDNVFLDLLEGSCRMSARYGGHHG